MEATFELAPAIPFRRSFDVQKLTQQLRGYLDPNNLDNQPGLDISRLSKVGIRNILFMGTALAVIISWLPARPRAV